MNGHGEGSRTEPPKKTLLLVEDEAIIALAEIRQLAGAGYAVLHATSGEEAVKTALQAGTRVDLILMDINLGRGMDGTEAAAEILKHRAVPVVFLSSHSEKEVVEKTEKITSYGYILKNAGETVLLASIRMAFKLFEARQDLAHGNRLMDTIIRHDYSAVAVFDRNMVYRYVSSRYIRDYRIAEKDLIGKSHYRVFPEMPERWKAVHRRVLAGEVISSESDPFPRADGTLDYIRWECRPLREQDGGIGGLILYSEVITPRIRAEEELRRSEERFRLLAENARDLIYRMELVPERRFSYVSPSALALTGYTPEEHYADPDLGRKLVDPGDLPKLDRAAEPSGFGKPLVLRWRRKDGSLFWSEQVISPIRDAENRLIAIEGIVRDVTERVDAEEHIREAQRLAVLGRWVLHIPSGRLEWSDTVFEIFGIDERRFGASYHAFLEAVHPDDRKAVNDAYSDSLVTRIPYRIEHRILTGSGRIKWVVESCRTEFDGAGRPLRSFGIVQDITDRKTAEETLTSLVREKDTLIRELLHRIGTGPAGFPGDTEESP